MYRSLTLAALLLLTPLTNAETVTLQHAGLTLNANLETTGENWQQQPVLLMTHGTLAHNQMEIMATLQEAFTDRGVSSLAITLSLGLSERTGMFDCATPHMHKHTDAIDEIGLWSNWLAEQGASSIVLMGHSRGGNQTAWYASTLDETSPVKGAILIAPMTWSEGYDATNYQERYQVELGPLLEKAQSLVAKGKGDSMLEQVDFIYCEETSASAAAFASYYSNDKRKDTPSLLNEIEVPVLVFAGSADDVVADLEKKMTALSDQEHISLSVLDGADHFFRDLFAEDLADEAVDFIESL